MEEVVEQERDADSSSGGRQVRQNQLLRIRSKGEYGSVAGVPAPPSLQQQALLNIFLPFSVFHGYEQLFDDRLTSLSRCTRHRPYLMMMIMFSLFSLFLAYFYQQTQQKQRSATNF